MIYLASPYSDPDPRVREARFRGACLAALALMRTGHHVFSPIAYAHILAKAGNLPGSWEYWSAFDEIMIRTCDAVVILMLDGWSMSEGVASETELAEKLGKPVTWLPVAGDDNAILDAAYGAALPKVQRTLVERKPRGSA